MAIHWGPARESGSNGARLGIDLTVSVSGTTATVVYELWLWTKRASFGSSASYSRGGSFGAGSGSFSYNHTNNSSDWPTSNRTRIGRWTTTRTLQYGLTQDVSATGSVSGLGGSIPEPVTHSRTVTVPARQASARPPAPTFATAAYVSDTQVTVNWGHPANINDPSFGIDGVQIQRWDNDTNEWFRVANLTGKPSSWTDRGTRGNRVYRYWVRFTGATGTGDQAFTGDVHTTPMGVSNVRAAGTSAGIRVTWVNASSDNATAIEVERQEDGGPWIGAGTGYGPARTDWVHADANPAKTHRYRVRARVDGPPVLHSPYATSNTVQIAAPPAAPTGLGPTSVWDATEPRELTWRHVPTDGAGQERFQVRHRPQGASTWTTATEVASAESRWTLPAGTYANGQGIEWQVRTWGPHPDPSPWSASALTTPRARPMVTITSPAAGTTIDTSSVRVDWSALDQSYYRVTLLRDGQAEQTFMTLGATRFRFISGLENGQTYTIRVEVRAGNGLWSLPDEITIDVEYVRPHAPLVAVDWDVELGAAIVRLEQPAWTAGTAEPAHHQLWRAIDDGPWLLIADEVPLGTAITDPIPATGDGRVNYYRARTVSTLPSTADSTTNPLAVTTRMTRGWVYLNAGPGMSVVCRVRANAKRSDSFDMPRELRQFADRPKRVLFEGTAEVLDWDISARIAPDYDGAATREELVALRRLGGAVCYRDPIGARWYGSMGALSSSWERITGEVSWSMSEVDHVEGLAMEGNG